MDGISDEESWVPSIEQISSAPGAGDFLRGSSSFALEDIGLAALVSLLSAQSAFLSAADQSRDNENEVNKPMKRHAESTSDASGSASASGPLPKRPFVGLQRNPPPQDNHATSAPAAPPPSKAGFVSGRVEANMAAARSGKAAPYAADASAPANKFKPPSGPAAAAVPSASAPAVAGKGTLLEKYGSPSSTTPLPPHLLGVDLVLAEQFAADSSYRGKDVDLDDVAGLSHVKRLLETAITQPLLMPDLEAHSSLLETPRNLLLFGPPGTGKTMLAKAVASRYGFAFFSVSASSISSKWQGESEKNVKALFGAAQELAPSVIFLDEIDSLLTARRDNEDASAGKIKTQFLVEMDGANKNEGKLVIIMGATNRPDLIDEAVRRRFTRRIHIPLPDLVSRVSLIMRSFAGHRLPNTLSEAAVTRCAEATAGFSSADLREVCRVGAQCAYNRWIERKRSVLTASAPAARFSAADVDEPVTDEDLVRALRQIRPSVSAADVARHEAFDETFGWKGDD